MHTYIEALEYALCIGSFRCLSRLLGSECAPSLFELAGSTLLGMRVYYMIMCRKAWQKQEASMIRWLCQCWLSLSVFWLSRWWCSLPLWLFFLCTQGGNNFGVFSLATMGVMFVNLVHVAGRIAYSWRSGACYGFGLCFPGSINSGQGVGLAFDVNRSGYARAGSADDGVLFWLIWYAWAGPVDVGVFVWLFGGTTLQVCRSVSWFQDKWIQDKRSGAEAD